MPWGSGWNQLRESEYHPIVREKQRRWPRSILFHLDKCIHFCEKATVDKSVTVAQAKLRKALFHLGYYQHGILEEAPKSSDVNIAETILSRVAKQQSDLAERSKVYLVYGQSLLAYRKGETNMATKLENKLRRKCEHHKIGFEIEQLNMLRTLVRGWPKNVVPETIVNMCLVVVKKRVIAAQ